jgi:hypothetical protein
LDDFKLCKNCGKYFEYTYGDSDTFCSAECAVVYTRCSTCGKYFPNGAGHSAAICSGECAIIYSMIKRYNEEKYVNYKEESA